MTGKEILEEEFEKAGMRGYRAEQVDTFLQSVAKYVDDQNDRNDDLTYKLKILADKIEEYKKDEGDIRDALLGAQKLGTSILNEAKAKAEAMEKEAKTSSDELLSQAKLKVESLTKDSLKKATMDINMIKREIDGEQRKLEAMKQEVSNFRSSILKQYKSHLDLLSNLPTVEAQPISFSSSSAPTQAPTQPKKNINIDIDDKPIEIIEDNDAKVDAHEDEHIENLEQIEQIEQIEQTKKAETSEIKIDKNQQIEESQQTIEFNSRTSNTTTLDLDEQEKEKVKNDFNNRLKKTTTFAEKYGELAFGSHKEK